MERTQEQWVKEQLQKYGEVSRNGALQNYISRLGAIVCDLNKSGWNIVGGFRKTEKGKDYVYSLVSEPYKPKVHVVERDGQRIALFS